MLSPFFIYDWGSLPWELGILLLRVAGLSEGEGTRDGKRGENGGEAKSKKVLRILWQNKKSERGKPRSINIFLKMLFFDKHAFLC